MSKVPYQSAVGALMYAMLGTRPDIAFAVTKLSQFSQNPGPAHWKALKRVLRYLKGTLDYQLTYRGTSKSPRIDTFPTLTGYCDADWGSDIDDRRSVTGYAFILAGAAISWQAKKQPTVALSSVEAEYMSATQATKESIWWRSFLRELGFQFSKATSVDTRFAQSLNSRLTQLSNEPTLIHSDSLGGISLTKNSTYHSRTKHIDIQHHFVREQVECNNVLFEFVPTDLMIADVLTKPLGRDKHESFMSSLGISHESSRMSGSVKNGKSD
jgi:hypothetical protein